MIIIAEKVNATRKAIRNAIQGRDEQAIEKIIKLQSEAGADYIDLNAGTGEGDSAQEGNDLCWLIDLALENSEKKLCLDSADPAAIERAVKHLDGRRDWMLNSVKFKDELLGGLLPIAADARALVIALAMDDRTIPTTADERIAVCEKIFKASTQAGVAPENIYFDPLVMPISTDNNQGRVTLDTLAGIKEMMPEVKTVAGLSNISYGLPNRAMVNQAFMVTAICHGLDAAICDPTDDGLMRSITLGELVAGRDKYCRGYTRACRKGKFD